MLKRVFLCFCLLMAGIGVVKAGDTYVKVTSPSDLVVGGEYIIAATKDGVTHVASLFDDKQIKATSLGFNVDVNTITISTATPLVFTLGESSSGFTLKFGTDPCFLGYDTSTSLKSTKTVTGDSEKWTYTYDETYGFLVKNVGDASRMLLVSIYESSYYAFRANTTTALGNGLAPANLYRRASTTTVTLSSACTDGARYYGTYSIGSSFIVPSDLTVSEIQVSDGKLVVSSYEAGDVVPANTGVMISAATAGAHQLTLSSAAGTSLYGAGNMLHASGEGITAEAMAAAHPGCKFYRLTMHLGTTLGYYWGAADGAAFALSANKAYLAVPAAASRLTGFDMADEEKPTGISAVLNDKERMKNDRGQALNDKVFDLNGRTVIGNVRGVVIKNGKKLLNK